MHLFTHDTPIQRDLSVLTLTAQVVYKLQRAISRREAISFSLLIY
jgi:hypothetical protein